jgi:hypothetical protein
MVLGIVENAAHSKPNFKEITHRYVASGLSVIKASKQAKAPTDGWGEFRTRRPTPEEIDNAFRYVYENTAIFIICGKVSGNLEILDFDLLREKFEPWRDLVEAQAPGLVERLLVQETQSGGRHIAYRCPDTAMPGNSKLALRLVDGKPQTLIETRGEGGGFLAAPTNGYKIIHGDFCDLPVITPEERQILWVAALSLNEYVDPKKVVGQGPRIPKGARRPGDDFNERGEVSPILEKNGWQPVGERGPYQHWRRPGKHGGTSASLIDEKIFYNFSANGHPFDMGAAYSPFGVFAYLEHDGDFEKAAKALRKDGYGGEEGKEEKKSQATLLIELAQAAGGKWWHTPNLDLFATIPAGNHQETWPIRSKAVRSWLTGLFYAESGKAPSAQAMQDALNTLEALAQFQGEKYTVYVRLAHHEGRIYIDLANDAWEVVEITADGWRVIQEAAVKFWRPRGLVPLPRPEPGGGLEELRPFINVESDDDWLNIVGWIIGAMSQGPYPVLTGQGVQGSAKTTLSRLLKHLLDPASSPVRAAPREVRDLMIAATNSHVLAFDNLSVVKDWLSDCYCRLATGGGFSTRELYTDGEEKIFDAMRPVILNGIGGLIHRQDLADRTIIIELPAIPESKRLPEAEFWRKFEGARPRILGAIYTALSAALKNQNNVCLGSLPRMADYALWVTAAEPALGWESGAFLAAYRKNRAAVIDQSLAADHVASAVKTLMAGKDEWEGTATDLLIEIEGLTPEAVTKSKEWPKAANQLSLHLIRAQTFLREVGIEVDRGRENKKRGITIRKIKESTVTTVTIVTKAQPCGFASDDGGDDGDDARKASSPVNRKESLNNDDGDAGDDEILSFSGDEYVWGGEV